MSKICLIDGKNFAFRHAYAHMGLKTSDGFPTGMLHGGLQAMVKMTKQFPGVAIVFCWDGRGTTWRHQTPPYLYKANRKKDGERPPEVEAAFMQFSELAKLLHGILKFKYLRVDGLEADDLIGLCTTAMTSKDREVLIVSTDWDFYQLVSDKVSVFHPKGDLLYTPKKVKDEFGVSPKDWLDYRAITGDGSDNLPGAPGLGPVKAKEALALGMKPSIPFERQHDAVKKKYPKLEKDWALVHYCWRMSKIAREPGDLSGCISPDLQDILAKKVVELASNPYRGEYKREDYRKLLQFLSRYEMKQMMRDRQLWWTVK